MSKVLHIMTTTTSVSAFLSQNLTTTGQNQRPFDGFPSLIAENAHPSGVPYLLCNEQGQDETLSALPNGTIQDPNAVHLGFSVWFNLDLIAQTKPSRAIICDIDSYVIELYKAIEKALRECNTELEFAEEMNRYISDKPFTRIDLKDELTRKGSWLSSFRSFNVVKQMSLAGKIRFGYLNLADKTGMFDQIENWLDQKNLYVQTLYISNIFVWLKKANMETLTRGSANIMKIVSHRTQTIHAFSTEGNEKNPLIQEVVSGDAAKKLANKIWDFKIVAPKPPSKRSLLNKEDIPKFNLLDEE